MTHANVQSWIDRYVEAWRSKSTAKLTGIFSSKITYVMSPWKPPLKSLSELEKFWEQSRSGPDEQFEPRSEIVAVENNTAVVRVQVEYVNDTPSQWRDLWIITFDETGLCSHFEEWPFSPEQDDGQTYGRA